MMLHVALEKARLIAQLSARALESVVDCESQIGMAFIGVGCMGDVDLASVGDRESDMDCIQSTRLVMVSRASHGHPACRDLSKTHFQLKQMIVNSAPDLWRDGYTIELELNWRLHDYPLEWTSLKPTI